MTGWFRYASAALTLPTIVGISILLRILSSVVDLPRYKDHRRDAVLLGHLASVILPDLLREVDPSKDAYRERLGYLGRNRHRDLGPRLHHWRGQ